MLGSLRRAGVVLVAGAALLAIPVSASAFSFVDVQANAPQVAGMPASDMTAVFPTNKQNETTIAVNPAATSTLLAGANDEQQQPPCGDGPVRGDTAPGDCSFFPGIGTDGVYRSTDGGLTWRNLGLLDDQINWRNSPYISDGDPVIVYGPKPDPAAAKGFSYARGARAYYVGLASFKDGASTYNANKAPEYIVVSYSDDNGTTWSTPVRATTKDNPNTFNDKNSGWVDDLPSSPYFGRLYVGFTAFRSATATGNGNAPVMVSRSSDGGASFGAPQQLSQAANNPTQLGRQGTDIASGPDGTVYVAWEEGHNQVVSVSRDGGTKYSKPAAIGAVTDIDSPIPGANFRTDSFPSIAADPRPGSTTLYASWTTKSGGAGRVQIARSTDRGASWSKTPSVVSSAAQGYAFFDSLDVAPSGRVDLGFQALTTTHPETFGTGNASISSYYVTGQDASFTAPALVSTKSSDPAASAQNNLRAQFWGDYSTTVSTASTAWFIWAADSRAGAGCAAVDSYQQQLAAAGLPTVMEDENAEPRAPAGTPQPAKPAPETQCPGQFGNTDARLAVITP